MNIYVGNLPFSADDNKLREIFGQHGTVTSASVISDKYTGRSRGFGFVEMESDDEAKAAIAALEGFDCDGRELKVSEAKPKREFS